MINDKKWKYKNTKRIIRIDFGNNDIFFIMMKTVMDKNSTDNAW